MPPLTPPAITDRAFWQSLADRPATAALLEPLQEHAEAAPPRPTLPSAGDYLAASRHNDRTRTDRAWQQQRGVLAALVIRRARLGMEEGDGDDRLLDWLWDHATTGSWAVAAHVAGDRLPQLDDPTLDLAACEMAAFLAEAIEMLKPWMTAQSQTLVGSLIHEIDRRVIGPFGEGCEVWWGPEQTSPQRVVNNWSGVCGGTILAACRALAGMGHPRPEAEARAKRTLRFFLDRAFTPGGECDEGLTYWNYGMTYAWLGLSRLDEPALAEAVDLERLWQVADSPRRAHIEQDLFYCANDGELRTPPSPALLRWLAARMDNDFPLYWLHQGAAPPAHNVHRHLGPIWRELVLTPTEGEPSAPPPVPKSQPATLLEDQQVAILRSGTGDGGGGGEPTGGGGRRIIATLGGGHNAENHNHNDLGHVMVIVDGRPVIPDLGRPAYTTDFFGPNRYRYLAASSRGHCCPVVNGHEQRPGADAAGRIIDWRADDASPGLELELAAAYPPEAKLQSWRRSLHRRDDADKPTFILIDRFQTDEAGILISHLLWSIDPPRIEGKAKLLIGPLVCELSLQPRELRTEPVVLAEHGLPALDGAETVYRISADYATDAEGHLEVRTVLTSADATIAT